MYLKKVDIQGFKSFADKTEIEFKNEVTAIVGPNGSGKSNISDAIRWVLGEQSIKNLRGSKMEDIIFSGTDKRRALGFAEVTITFDNNSGKIPIDYSEVAVTRRMFRSGESEYYLNKNSCRLKDIRELFMDSGIGKDGYSIIGQGKIDEIISSKPEDRRNIFEEAAGIIKFKTKKEEAERKLDKTDNNIVRIKDLILEVSNQKEVLEIESQKATQFTKLYSKLRGLEVNLYIRDIKKLNKQINDATTEKEKIIKDLSSIEVEKNIIEEKYNLLKLDISSMEKEIEKSRTIKFDTIQSFEKNKNQSSIFQEKENYLKKDIERLESEKEKTKASLIKLEESKIDLNSELDKINHELKKLNNEFRCKNTNLEEIDKIILNEESSLEKYKDSIISKYNLASDKKSEINSIISFNENIDNRIIQLKNDIEGNTSIIGELVKKEESLKATEDSLKENLKEEKDQISILNLNKMSIEKEYNDINDNIKSNQIKLNGLNASFNLYKNMEAGYEGYFKSVKGLLQESKKNKDLNKGLIGVVADLIKVEFIYEKAIDITLGSNIQNIVVETEDDAKKFVEYLKKNKLGRATFLPLNVIKGKTLKLDPKDKVEYGILGLAHELVSYDKKYSNIFESLMGRTIIVRNIDFGIKLANKYGHIYRIVTLEGEVLNAGGSITGGSYGKDSISIINRKNKIENLNVEIADLNEEIINFENKNIRLVESLNELETTIIKIDSSIKEIDLKIFESINSQSSNRYEINRLNGETTKKISEIDILTKELDVFKVNKDQLTTALDSIEKQIESIKKEIEEKSNTIVSIKLNRSELDKELTNIRISMNTIEHSKTILESSSQNYNTNKQQLEDLIEEKNTSINLLQDELKESQNNRKQLEEELTKYETTEEDLTKILNDLIKKKDNYMKTFYDEQDMLKVINKKISEIEKLNNNIELRLARYELQLENNHIKLLEDYELTIQEAFKYETEIENVQNAQNDVKDLKNEIKLLGNVNISAIDEFKKVTERYDFITAQHNDLINAKVNIKEVIRDMEKKMRSQFIDSFKEINDSFIEVFSVLFNGGVARLELEDNEDILKSGIEIKVQPPGKKLQSLSLLSGGEKSLTAVALLFAILKTKPAPFCILDEIDAALDEANINRYTSYLKKFNDMTQFVLITHRKTTMEIADVLYGVTMEEEGVSKLISVKLKNNLVEAS